MNIAKKLLSFKLPDIGRFIRPTDLLLLVDISLFVALIGFHILIPGWAWIFFATLSVLVFYGPLRHIDTLWGWGVKKEATFIDAALAVERMIYGQEYQDRKMQEIRDISKKKDQ